jgi:CshA-type fibril repeat protein
VAVEDIVAVVEDTPVTGNVLSNDSDPDSNPLSVVTFKFVGATNEEFTAGTAANIPGVGTLLINRDGSFIFTPLPDYNGPVPLVTYTIDDGVGASNSTARGTLILGPVTPVNDTPVAFDDTATTTEDKSLVLSTAVLLNNDTGIGDGPVTITSVQGAVNGTVTLNPVTGNVTFTPTANYHGPASFTYTITDIDGQTSTATVNLTVASVNDAPVANADGPIATQPDGKVTGNVLANDTDIDGDALTVTQFTIPRVGTFNAGDVATIPGVGRLVINTNGSFVFTPATGYTGPVPTVTYTISDGIDFSSAQLKFADIANNQDNNIGALILLSNPTPSLFPASNGPTYSLLSFREPNLDWGNYHPAQLSWYGLLQDYDIYLTGSIKDQFLQELKTANFTVPPGTFRHSNPNEKLEYTAMKVDGTALPIWLDFDPKKLKFSGTPPKGQHNLEIIVKAKDRTGKTASATFKIILKKADDVEDKPGIHVSVKQPTTVQKHIAVTKAEPISIGKASFSEQLGSTGKFIKLAESRKLLDSLNNL